MKYHPFRRMARAHKPAMAGETEPPPEPRSGESDANLSNEGREGTSLSSGWNLAGFDGFTVVGILEVESLDCGSGSALRAKGEEACCNAG